MTEPLALRQPADNLEELQRQLLRELDRLEEEPAEEPELFRAYLQHALILAWRGVADGRMRSPRKILECLRPADPFIDHHMPDLSPAQTAAVEVYFTTQCLYVAAEALEERRVEDRLSEARSETERAILQTLAGSRGTYLRRGEIHDRLPVEDRPTPPRVGQILAELHEENVVLRIHGRAQGNPAAAFYALSPWGLELCRSLGLIREKNEEDLPPAILEAIEIACNPNLDWSRRRMAHGVLATAGLGPRKSSVLKALIGKAESDRNLRVQGLVDEALRQVVTASQAPHAQAKGGQRSNVYISQKPEQEPQLAELACASA